MSLPCFTQARAAALLLAVAATAAHARGEMFRLPTANQAIFEKGGEEKFYIGTTGKTWTTGTFGCVRSDGRQMHEGLDIRCLQRDKRGEPIDAVMATADGVVAYVNRRPSLSNYGNYLVLRHRIEGLEIYSLYAHLQSVRADLRAGQAVKGGETVGIMGRTSNTGEAITKERAHVHFELNLVLNDGFAQWYRKTFPGQRNDHGMWNGQNMGAIDPRAILLEQRQKGANFSLVQFLRSETELCRVFVRDTNFPWLKRYAPLVARNPVAEKEGVAGYELTLNFNGVAIMVVPRAASEINGKGRIILLSVNEAEQNKNPARGLVVKRGSRWELTTKGLNLLELLVY